MKSIVFYEKPGCASNTRQKTLLQAAGYAIETRDLLIHPWTEETLRPFFGGRPVADWFNRAAPRVKTGEIVPETFTESTALAAMLADPLLIRRPLIQLAGQRMAGFDAEVEQRFGMVIRATDMEGCTSDIPCKSNPEGKKSP